MRMANNSLSELIKYIYPNIQAGHFQDRFFLERTILSGRNDDVDEINQQVLDMFPGQETVYWSTDKTIEEELDDAATLYPVEFLQNFNASGLPCAKLALKVGCPLMLLRNLDPANGLCNGTRMILTRFHVAFSVVTMQARLFSSHASQSMQIQLNFLLHFHVANFQSGWLLQ